MVLALSGIGGFFALSLNAQMVVFLLTAFSVYDFIAVYKTKHMQKIASEMVKYDSILAFLVPKTLRELKSPLGKSKERLFVLGGGDIVFPLLLSASLIKEDVLSSFIVAVFSLIGLYFSFWIFYKKSFKSAMPALPPIALLSIIGYLFVQIFLTI
jgi:presenilin-like A22 family membrane protease